MQKIKEAHHCPEWDGMFIKTDSPDGEACTCNESVCEWRPFTMGFGKLKFPAYQAECGSLHIAIETLLEMGYTNCPKCGRKIKEVEE